MKNRNVTCPLEAASARSVFRFVLRPLFFLFSLHASAQTELTNGGSHAGNIPASGNQSWIFSANAGNPIQLRASQSSGGSGFSPRLKVFNSANLLVGHATSGTPASSSSSARLSFVPPASGSYRVVVDSSLAAGSGNYRLDYLRLPGAVTIPSGDTGGPLTNGVGHAGAISTGDVDVWSVSAVAGSLLDLRVAQTSGNSAFAPRVRIYTSGGELVGEASGGTSTTTSEARVSLTLETGGTYSVVVDSASEEGTGNYRVESLCLPGAVTLGSGDTGGPLANGGAHEGSITVGDLDVWTIPAVNGKPLELRLGQLTGGTGFRPRLRVFNPSGSLVGLSSADVVASASEARLTLRPTATEALTVVVDSNRPEGAGNYRLHALKVAESFITSPGDDGATLASGNRHDGTTTLGDVDPWTFQAAEGDLVQLRAAQLTGGSSYVPRMQVFDAAGDLVGYAGDATSSSASESRLDFLPKTTGTYTVVVDSGAKDGTGTYRLYHLKLPGSHTIPAGDEGGALTSGSNHDGSIPVGDLDSWSFSATAGDRLDFVVSQLSGGSTFAPRMRIYRSTGELVGYGHDPLLSSSSSASLAFFAPTTDSYHVVVDSSLVRGTGNYRLNYLKTAGPFSNPPASGAALTNGGNHEGAIAVAGNFNSWTFAAKAGDNLHLRLGELTGSINSILRMRLHGPLGQLLGDVSDHSDPSIGIIAPSHGTYTVEINTGAGHTTSYRLHYINVAEAFSVPAGDEGGGLANGGNHEGTIPVGDLDTWTFTAAAGESLLLRLGELTGTINSMPRIRLYDPLGQLLGDANDYSDPSISVIAPSHGAYTAVISCSTGDTSNYRLHYVKSTGAFSVPGGDDGGALTNGGNHEGAINMGDLDPWTFTAAAGESLLLRVGELTGTVNSAPRIRLYDPLGQLLGDASHHSDPSISVVAPSHGVYTAVISCSTGDTSTYRLHYVKSSGAFSVPGGDEGGAIANGGNHEGAINMGDLDPWTFTAAAGDNLLLRVGEFTGSVNSVPRIRLYDPLGQLVGDASDNSDPSISIVAPSGGTYTAVISTSTGDTCTYRLHYFNMSETFTIPGGDEGGALTNGGNHEGVITVGDLDGWTFTAAAGESLLLRLGELTGSANSFPRIRLYDPLGQLIGEAVDNADPSVSIVAPVQGIYTAMISTSAGQTCSYRLHHLKVPGGFIVPGGDEGGTLSNGGNHEGVITIGDLDAWTFTISQDQPFFLRAARLGDSASIQLRLYDPAGNLIGNASSTSSAAVDITAPSPGVYTAVVSYSTGYTGDYMLNFLQVPGNFSVTPGDEGGPLAGDGTYEGNIVMGDLDAWSFIAKAGNAITIRMQEITGSNFSPFLRIYGPQGQLMGSHSHSSLAQLTFTATVSGVYTVVAAGGTASGYSTYTLSATGLPDQTVIPVLPPQPLTISRQGEGTLVISWPNNLTGYVLQYSGTLQNDWADVPAVVGNHDGKFHVTVPLNPPRGFFRLRPGNP